MLREKEVHEASVEQTASLLQPLSLLLLVLLVLCIFLVRQFLCRRLEPSLLLEDIVRLLEAFHSQVGVSLGVAIKR
jgi:Flp pilus assembly protein protease CpaA